MKKEKKSQGKKVIVEGVETELESTRLSLYKLFTQMGLSKITSKETYM